jgi:hypothetical protein
MVPANDDERTGLTLALSYTLRYTRAVSAAAAPLSPKPPATPVLSSSRRGTEPAPASPSAHATTKIAKAAAKLAANVATASCTLAAATVTATALSGAFTPLAVGMGLFAGGRCAWRALGQRSAARRAAATCT